MNPLITIIIPLYNRGHLIERTMESIKQQTHGNWECIIVDDGSTDNSMIVVQDLIKKDTRFQLYSRPVHKPKGANACRNYGLDLAKGEYINFLDSDDTFYKEKLTYQLAILEGSDYQFSVCQTMVVDDLTLKEKGLRSDTIESIRPLDDYIIFKCFWTVHPPLYKAAFIKKYQFDESLQQSQEYELTIRILGDNPTFHTSEKVLVNLHAHNDRMSSSVVDHNDKIKSNLKVRFYCFKNLSHRLLPETQDHLYQYVFNYYKILVFHKEWSKAFIVYTYLVRCSPYYYRLKRQRKRKLTSWFLAIPSYLFFDRGENFLKSI